jgi:hypothetical protein
MNFGKFPVDQMLQISPDIFSPVVLVIKII